MEKMMIGFLVICGLWVCWRKYEIHVGRRMNDACDKDKEPNGV